MSESKYSTQGQQKSQRERAKTFPSMDDYYENSFLRNWQLKGRRKVFDLSHRNAAAAAAKLLQLCLTLCDPIDNSPPGSAVHGIFQTRELEWGGIAFCLIGIGVFYPDLLREFYFYNKMSGKKIKKCLHWKYWKLSQWNN